MHDTQNSLNAVASTSELTLNRVGSVLQATAALFLSESTRDFVERFGETLLAYHHDNGFLKIELLRSSDTRVRLRMHVWGAGGGRTVSQAIHNHSFDFVSLILLGVFDATSFRVEESRGAQQLGRYGYHRRDRMGRVKYQLRDKGGCYASEVGKKRYSPGDMYAMIGKNYHTFDHVGDGLGATIVLSKVHDDDRDASILLRGTNEGEVERGALPLSIDSVSSILSQVRRLCRKDATR